MNCTAWSGSGTSKICTAGTYDEHYLIGNYYQFNAATAGSGGSITNADAEDSICPKGWMLPTAGPQADNVSGSFQNMLSKYGLASSVSAGSYNIAAAPLYFVRSGYFYKGGNIRKPGQFGDDWSSRSSSTHAGGSSMPCAYNLGFDISSVRVSEGPWERFHGFPVRCLSII